MHHVGTLMSRGRAVHLSGCQSTMLLLIHPTLHTATAASDKCPHANSGVHCAVT